MAAGRRCTSPDQPPPTRLPPAFLGRAGPGRRQGGAGAAVKGRHVGGAGLGAPALRDRHAGVPREGGPPPPGLLLPLPPGARQLRGPRQARQGAPGAAWAGALWSQLAVLVLVPVLTARLPLPCPAGSQLPGRRGHCGPLQRAAAAGAAGAAEVHRLCGWAAPAALELGRLGRCWGCQLPRPLRGGESGKRCRAPDPGCCTLPQAAAPRWRRWRCSTSFARRCSSTPTARRSWAPRWAPRPRPPPATCHSRSCRSRWGGTPACTSWPPARQARNPQQPELPCPSAPAEAPAARFR
jgi:hypothetical protein